MNAATAMAFIKKEINTKGHEFHELLFLAIKKMSIDIKKRFKKGDTLSLGEAKMVVELGKGLQEEFFDVNKDIPYYIGFSFDMGKFARKSINFNNFDANAIDLMEFYNKVICKI
jgi:hypothetical protein